MKRFLKCMLSAVVLVLLPMAVNAESFILSDNNLRTVDYEKYAEQGETVKLYNTGAEYSWTETSDTDLLANDKAHEGNKMTDGYLSDASGKFSLYASWNSTPSTAIFDLKDVHKINRVDIWAVSGQSIQLGNIKISVSKDLTFDENELVVKKSATMPEKPAEVTKDTKLIASTMCTFEPVKGRYVKIELERAATTIADIVARQYLVSEILIFGEPTYKPTIEDFYFYDETGDRRYSKKTAKDKVFAKAELSGGSAAFISALYDGDLRLKNTYLSQNTQNLPTSKYEFVHEFNNVGKTDEIKAFLFNSINELKPLDKEIALTDKDISVTGILCKKDFSKSGVKYPVIKGFEWIKTGEEKTASGFYDKEAQLFDGDTNTLVSVTEENACADLEIEFENPVRVSRVNIYSMCSTTSFLNEFSLYASYDGINYEFVETKVNSLKTGEILPISLKIKGILYAKNIRIVMTKDSTASSLEISEIEVYGNPPTMSRDKMREYYYDTNAPFKTASDIIAADSDNNLLTDDDKNTEVISEGDYVSVIFDFSDYRQVEKITVYGEHSGCEYLSSPDGVNYFTMGFFAEENGETLISGMSENNAKFLKLIFRKGDLDNISLKEIEVYARPLYDVGEEKNTTPDEIPVRAKLKDNNILYLDWTDYNGVKNNVSSYYVFIEKTQFTSTAGKSPKQVYVRGNETPIYEVSDKYCQYAGLEPDTDYYVAVAPNNSGVSVSTVKVHTNSALGGETLSGIFAMNEYPYGGGIHVDHDDEKANLNLKLKLLNDLEVVNKTRWAFQSSQYNQYLSRGISNHAPVSTVDISNAFGAYSFAGMNEPDISPNVTAEEYVNTIKSNYSTVKGANSKNILSEAAICGTDHLDFIEELYELEPNLGDYYDVFDAHLYCKAFEGMGNLEDNISSTSESYSVPEHLFAKLDRIRTLLEKNGDGDKDIISTEIGWSTHTNTTDSVFVRATLEEQANFVARTYLISAALDIKNVFLYAFQDEGPTTDNIQYQFGIVDWYGNPKPGYYTYYTLGKLLKNTTFKARIDTLSHPDYGMLFYDKTKNMYLTALWNISGDGSEVNFTSNDNKMLKVDAYGNSEYIENGKLNIGSAPVYIYSTDIPTLK